MIDRRAEPFLLTPGPLTTSSTTKQAMLRDWGSRDPAFMALNARVRSSKKQRWPRACPGVWSARSAISGGPSSAIRSSSWMKRSTRMRPSSDSAVMGCAAMGTPSPTPKAAMRCASPAALGNHDRSSAAPTLSPSRKPRSSPHSVSRTRHTLCTTTTASTAHHEKL